MADESPYRSDFPVLAERLYFDTAALGLVPRRVQEVVLQRHVTALGFGTADPNAARREGEVAGARTAAAQLLGVEARRVAIGSSAMAVLRDALWRFPARAGNAVVFRHDYPDLVLCFQEFCEARSIQLRSVESSCGDTQADLAALRAAVDAETQLIAVTNVHPWTGRELSLAPLVELAKSAEASLVIDATQSVGAASISPVAADVDLILFAGYKWLVGALGAAVAAVSDRWLAQSVAHGEPAAEAAEILEPSTMSSFSAACLRASLEYLLDVGPDTIAARNRTLGANLRRGLRDLGARFAAGEQSSAPHIVSARFPGVDSGQLTDRLKAAGVAVSLREGWVRWAPHFYNSELDVERALEVLASALPRVAVA
jgi:selenocysteine lyase/cysteine desulfurase